MDVVRVWHDDEYVHLLEHLGGVGRRFRSFRAPWVGFLRCSRSYASSLARRGGVVSVASSGEYYRVEFADHGARWSAAREARDELGRDAVREFDVDPARRWITEHQDVQHVPVAGLLVDVECQVPGSTFRDQVEGRVPILAVSARDMATGEEVYGATLPRLDTDDERELVLGFWRTARAYDVLVAWNGDFYDFRLLGNRTHQLGVEARHVIANPQFRGDLWERWARLDQKYVDEKSRAATGDGDEKSTSRLDDVVAHRSRGAWGKVELPTRGHPSEYYEAWRAYRDVFDAYRSRDTQLQHVNEELTGYLEGAMAAARLCHCSPDTSSQRPIVQADGLVLRESQRHGYKWPTLFGDEEKTEQWYGAWVMQPTRVGVVDGVICGDYASMYPRNASSGHMSPENHEDPESSNAIRLPGRPGAFRLDRRGIFPEIIDSLLANRARYQTAAKAETPGTIEHRRLKALSDAAKIVANSIAFGVTGTTKSRFCDQQTFEGITTTGRWLIQRTAQEAELWGAEVIAGDSDSLFWTTSSMDLDRSREFCSHVTRSIPDWLTEYGWPREDCIAEFEFDEAFHRLVFSQGGKGDGAAKKRYIARHSLYKGKEPAIGNPHKIKGWEYQKGSSTWLQRRMQEELFNLFLGDPSAPLPERDTLTPDLFRGWAMRWYERVLGGDFDMGGVATASTLKRAIESYERRCTYTRGDCAGCGHDLGGKAAHGPTRCPSCGQERRRAQVPTHVRVARELRACGRDVVVGERIRWVWVLSDDGADRRPAAADEVQVSWVDRASVWEGLYAMVRRQLEAAFPGEDWSISSARRIRAVQHQQLMGVGDLFSAAAPVAQRSRDTVLDVGMDPGEKQLALVQELVRHYPGGDVLHIQMVLGLEDGQRAVQVETTSTWDARRAALKDRSVAQVGSRTYRLLT